MPDTPLELFPTLSNDLNPTQEPDSKRSSILHGPTRELIQLLNLDIPDVAFFSCDDDWRFTYLSDNAPAVFAGNPSCSIGKKFFDTLSLTDFQNHARMRWQSNEISLPLTITIEIVGFDGAKRTLRISHRALIVDDAFVGVTGMAKPFPIAGDLASVSELVAKGKLLSKAQRAVVELVVAGKMNKVIASELGIAIRTVESRRAKSMVKLNTPSHSQMVQLWLLIKQAEGQMTSVDDFITDLNSDQNTE